MLAAKSTVQMRTIFIELRRLDLSIKCSLKIYQGASFLLEKSQTLTIFLGRILEIQIKKLHPVRSSLCVVETSSDWAGG